MKDWNQLKDKYRNDNEFAVAVDCLYALMAQHRVLPDDMRDIADCARMKWFFENTEPFWVKTPEERRDWFLRGRMTNSRLHKAE